MSETNNAVHKARIVLELSADGSDVILECYRNGQRQRLMLTRGQEWWEALDALKLQQRDIDNATERKAQRKEREALARHRRVWIDAAENHGAGFAKQVIRGSVPQGYGKYLKPEPAAKPKPTAKPAKLPVAEIQDLLNLL